MLNLNKVNFLKICVLLSFLLMVYGVIISFLGDNYFGACCVIVGEFFYFISLFLWFGE